MCLCERRGDWQSGRNSCEVHGPQRVVVDLNSFGKSLRVTTVTLTRHMTPLSTVKERKGGGGGGKQERRGGETTKNK